MGLEIVIFVYLQLKNLTTYCFCLIFLFFLPGFNKQRLLVLVDPRPRPQAWQIMLYWNHLSTHEMCSWAFMSNTGRSQKSLFTSQLFIWAVAELKLWRKPLHFFSKVIYWHRSNISDELWSSYSFFNCWFTPLFVAVRDAMTHLSPLLLSFTGCPLFEIHPATLK